MLLHKLLHRRDLPSHKHFRLKSYGVHCPLRVRGGELNSSEKDSDLSWGTELLGGIAMRLQLRTHPWSCWIGFTLSLGAPLLTACGNPSTPAAPSASSTSSSTSSSSSVSVVITPSAATVAEGGSFSYAATVNGSANTAVAWSIQEGTIGGSITNSGVYTAPNTLGIYHVVATSVADATASASAVVSTEAPPITSASVSITITPSAATIAQGASLSFSATVRGLANAAVWWSIQEGTSRGTITSSGVYTAPTNGVGELHVVATSVADSTVSAVVKVSVEPPPSTAPAAGIFTAVGNMTTVRVGHTATLLGNGKVLIAGGSSDGVQPIASAELYDPSTRTFAPTGSMITPHQYHSATLLADGRVLITGGISGFTVVDGVGGNIPILTSEIYDPSTGAFTATGDLISTAGAVLAYFPGDVTTLLPDGRVLVAATNNAEIYDPHSGTFTLTGPFADPGSFNPNTVTLLTNGKVLVTLWWCNSNCSNIAVAELFDPQSGTFSKTGAMMAQYVPDFGYTAALLTDGRVFFLGSDDIGSADVEIYDPAAGTFASIGGSFSSQVLAPASRLTDGTVLIAGGELPGGSGSTNAEVYVPASGTLEYAGQMTSGRHSHKATALPDDTVLLTGGYTFWYYPNLQPVSTAEIYKPR